MMTTRAGAVALAVAVLVGGACSSGDDDDVLDTSTTTTTTEADNEPGPGEAAMQMLEQFGAGEWAAFYEQLAPAQKELVGREHYVASCVDAELADSIARAELAVVDTAEGAVTLSGTGTEVDGVQVTYSMTWDHGAVDESTMTVVHDADGWHWTMANLNECLGVR